MIREPRGSVYSQPGWLSFSLRRCAKAASAIRASTEVLLALADADQGSYTLAPVGRQFASLRCRS
jgi:hypothetical protein